MRVDQLNVIVQDMDAAVDFYRRLGFEVPDTLPEWQPHHRTVTSGDGFDVDLDSPDFAMTWGGVDRGVVIGVRTSEREAVDERYEALTAAGYEVLKAPYDAFFGARIAVVRDRDGNTYAVMSPIDEAYRTASPEPPS